MKRRICFLVNSCLVFACFTFFGCGEKTQTVAEYSQSCINKINKELKDPDHEVKRRIENAHGTVTVRELYVSRFRAETYDGTDNAGKNGENISEREIYITARWDGIFHKNGYTEFKIVQDFNSGKINVRECGIIASNALINIEDPEFWYGVGAALLLI